MLDVVHSSRWSFLGEVWFVRASSIKFSHRVHDKDGAQLPLDGHDTIANESELRSGSSAEGLVRVWKVRTLRITWLEEHVLRVMLYLL